VVARFAVEESSITVDPLSFSPEAAGDGEMMNDARDVYRLQYGKVVR
jgi:hypothetical protein